MKALLVLPVILGQADAEIVLWTATGSVTSTSGSFLESAITAATPVGIRMTYDDSAEEVILKEIATALAESDFRTNIHLSVKITIGGHIWEGAVTSGTSVPPDTLVTRSRTYVATESFEVRIDGIDQGVFPFFPFSAEGATPAIDLKFFGPNTLLGVGIESLEINPSVITSATGFLQSGSASNKLQFSINPASVAVLDLRDEPFSPRISTSSPDSQFQISWSTDPRFKYRIERSDSLETPNWNEVESIDGTGASVSRQFPRSSTSFYYRVVTASKPR